MLSSPSFFPRTDKGSTEFPEWVERHIRSYAGHYGVVIWDNRAEKVSAFSAGECLALLERLINTTDWKESGVSLTKQVHQISLPTERKTKRRGKSSEVIQAEEKEEKPSSVLVDKEVLRLPPEAGEKLISLFEENKKLLIQDAKMEEKMRSDALRRVYDLLFDLVRKNEVQKADFLNRKFPWTEVNNKPDRWLCQRERTRAVVYLNPPLYWCACIENQKKDWKSRHDFKNLEEAVEWVEAELTVLDQMPVDEEKPVNEEPREVIQQRIREKMARSPYMMIKSVDLEPASNTYKVVIDIETKAIGSQTCENPFGEIVEYDKKYTTPVKLANQLQLDPDQYEITFPFGEDTAWCRFCSLVTFFQNTLAISQAQSLWSQSLIVQQFKARHVVRARYGYKENETGYTVYLGGCFNPENPWGKNETRQEYLEELALRLSIFNTLEIGLLREYLGLQEDSISDEKLLVIMHEARAESRFVSSEERKASQIWLIEQNKK